MKNAREVEMGAVRIKPLVATPAWYANVDLIKFL